MVTVKDRKYTSKYNKCLNDSSTANKLNWLIAHSENNWGGLAEFSMNEHEIKNERCYINLRSFNLIARWYNGLLLDHTNNTITKNVSIYLDTDSTRINYSFF